MDRTNFIPYLAVLCIGIVAGTLLSSQPDPPAPPVRPQATSTPVPEPSGSEDDTEYLRSRIAEMEAYIEDMRSKHEEEVASLTSALETAKEMLKRRPARDVRDSKRKSAFQVVKEDPEFYAEKTGQDDRYIPYMAYRSYRPYRPFRSYKQGEKKRFAGSKADCNDYPNASECYGTYAACEADPDVPGCVGTDMFCREFPQDKHCVGTEAFCRKNKNDATCAGTKVWCMANPNHKLCRGTETDCIHHPQRTGCYGTKAFCATDAGQVCLTAKEQL